MDTKDIVTVKQNTSEEDLLSNYKGKWKNISFTKDGSSFYGERTYNTEQEAKKAKDAQVKRLSEKLKTTGQDTNLICVNGSFLFSTFSHAIQIPSK